MRLGTTFHYRLQRAFGQPGNYPARAGVLAALGRVLEKVMRVARAWSATSPLPPVLEPLKDELLRRVLERRIRES